MFRLAASIILLATCAIAHAAQRPNILWLSAEDMSPHLGCYGDKHARTPNIDRLAAEGILYENAFSTAPVCAPSRSAIITGVYATSLGSHHMRSMVALPPEIRPFPAYLREAGYYCTNNSKEDYNFRTPPGSWDDSSGRAHWRNRPDPEQPFFAVFNYTGTHESHIRGDEPAYSRAIARLKPEELHDPASLDLPPYYPDTPKVRAEWARYYNLVTALNHWVADHLKELDDAGLADDTIVMFWSDHGVGMPRGKRWLYDSGLHVPLIVRLPPKYEHLRPQGSAATHRPPPPSAGEGRSGSPPPGGEGLGEGRFHTDELISLVDLAPTVLNLAGLPIPTYMQGRAFLGENLTPQREYIFAARDRMDERYDMTRVVRTKKYSYIRNFMPWRPYAQWLNYGEQSPTMQELRRLHAEGKLTPEQARFLSATKPVEELYDLENDPHQTRNLLENDAGEYGPLAYQLSQAVQDRQRANFDLGYVPESELAMAETNGSRSYERFRTNQVESDYFTIMASAIPADDAVDIEGNELSPEEEMAMADAAARYWHCCVQSYHSTHAQTSRAADSCDYTIAIGLEDSVLAVRLGAAEMLIYKHKVSTALPVLLEALEHAPSPWDQLQAANVLDLLPDFDKHAHEIRPVVDRVHEKLSAKPAREQTQAEGYILRVTAHLRERLAK